MLQYLIIVFVLILGLFLLIKGLFKNKEKTECPATKIVYQLVPKTFLEEQEDPEKVSDVFADMFYSAKEEMK